MKRRERRTRKGEREAGRSEKVAKGKGEEVDRKEKGEKGNQVGRKKR